MCCVWSSRLLCFSFSLTFSISAGFRAMDKHHKADLSATARIYWNIYLSIIIMNEEEGIISYAIYMVMSGVVIYRPHTHRFKFDAVFLYMCIYLKCALNRTEFLNRRQSRFICTIPVYIVEKKTQPANIN